MPYERLTQPDPQDHPPEVRRLLDRQRVQRGFGLWLPFSFPSAGPQEIMPSSIVAMTWAAAGIACLVAGAVTLDRSPVAGWILLGVGVLGCLGGANVWWAQRTLRRRKEER